MHTDRYKIYEEIIEKRIGILEKVVDEYVEAIAVNQQPEQLIGKKYEEWGPVEHTKFKVIFGGDEGAMMWKTKKDMKIANREEEELRAMEGR